MKYKSFVYTTIFLFVLLNASKASASIFDSSGSSGGIFGGVRDRLDDIFDDLFQGVPGGSSIPGLSPTPTPEGGVPVDPGTGLPPAADSVKQLKLTLEWDALSLGGEAVQPEFEDRLEELHRDFLVCPQCSSGSAYNSVVIDEYNRVLPAIDGQLASAPRPQEPPRPYPPPPGGSTTSPWEICPVQTECLIADIERVLTGWCGQDPNLINDARVPDISRNSPGPNMFSLPNSVSNKYVRRDGYAFKCVTSCNGSSCVKDNYVEFQTMIYPSNAISLYLRVENPTALPIENVLIDVSGLTYSPEGEYALPHNVDVPFESNVVDSESLYENNGFSYAHGSTLVSKIDRGLSVLRTVDGVNLGLRRSPDNTSSTQVYIGPFDIGANQVLDFPIQPESSEFSRIPETTTSYDRNDVSLNEPAVPCECQGVRLHRGTSDDPDCNTVITNPTVDQCRLYYGIGIPSESGPDHAGGYLCNRGGIPVTGCAPPWCFERLASEGEYVGPMEMCPNGEKIPLPTDPQWYFNVNFDNTFNTYNWEMPVERADEIIMSLQELLPESIFKYSDPQKAFAFGCTQPCQNDPPPGISGVGGIIPRDYNFICDPDDKGTDGTMRETSRCQGTDPQVLIKPTNPDGSDNPLFDIYRDVTGIGGCGYNASSNNSVIGPIQVTARYGGTGEERTSRSVVVGSIPVGGRLSDDQARPYGWPMTGVINELWGYTSLADSNPSRAIPSLEHGEYRYCAPN